MALAYIENHIVESLSNKALMKKYWEISKMMSKVQNRKTPSHIVEEVTQLYNLYETELNRRLDEDIIEEDEANSFWEEIEEDEDEELLGFKL